MSGPPIQDASTLVIVRHDLGEPRILMGRRSGGHTFMPDKWVFPGGRLDIADYRAPALQELSEQTEEEVARTARLKRQDGKRLARALALAAIRETFEETGLILGRPHEGVRTKSSWRPFFDSGYAPDLGGLSYIARAITPPARVRRYDTRFFLADAEELTDTNPRDSRELSEVDWFTLNETLNLDLPRITRLIMETVAAHVLGRPPENPPFWHWRGGLSEEKPLISSLITQGSGAATPEPARS